MSVLTSVGCSVDVTLMNPQWSLEVFQDEHYMVSLHAHLSENVSYIYQVRAHGVHAGKILSNLLS